MLYAGQSKTIIVMYKLLQDFLLSQVHHIDYYGFGHFYEQFVLCLLRFVTVYKKPRPFFI